MGVTGVVAVGVVVGTAAVVVGTAVVAPPPDCVWLFAFPHSFKQYWVAAESRPRAAAG